MFERCAVDLLRDSYYSNLRGTPDGRDAGIDGITGPDADPEFVLVATTAQDFARNLRQSVRSHLDADGPGRRFVFATTREVTMKRRLELAEELHRRWGVELWAVHDRGDFVRLLYDHPQWRKDLLGVAGAAKALSRFPANSRPTPAVPLIGRDADLQRLQAVTGDLLLAGRPGVGKTFLVEQLASEGWGLFDAGWAIDKLEDAVREMNPRRVVVDDAHLKEEEEDRLPQVMRLRREMNVDFGIVAVSWPGQADTVAGKLPEAKRFDVDELERDQIVEVIKQAGIGGPPELQRTIVDQARGCVGLAVTLARACVAGRVHEVATGEALVDDLVRWYERTLGPESRHMLGVLALAGDGGATLGQAREILGLTVPQSSDLIRGLASGGTIDEVPYRAPRMRVQPEALRYALVRDVFSSGPGSLDAASAIDGLDPPSIAAIPLIGASHRGADVDRGLLQSIVDWSDKRTAVEYACLGPGEFPTALERAPAHRTPVAEAALKLRIDTPRAVRVLMEQAVGDDRLEHSTPEHPLRIVGDHLARRETPFEARRLAVEVADSWFKEGGDGEVGVRVLMHAVRLEVHGASRDPGIGDTLQIYRGMVPKPWIDQLSRLWDSILDIFDREPDLPPAPLLDALHPWVHPSTVVLGPGLDDEASVEIRRIAARVIARLAEIFGDRPGVLRSLKEHAERGNIPVPIDLPDYFAVLFPKRWDGSDEDDEFDGWQRRADAGVRRLAEQLRKESTDDIAAFIVGADSQAATAGITYPRHTPHLARRLAADSDSPEALLAALEASTAAPDIRLPLLDRVAELQRPGWEATLERLLAEDRAAWVPIQVALTRPCDNRLKQLAIEQTGPWLSLIDNLVIMDQIEHATLALLFDAPDASVRQQAATTIGSVDSGRRLKSLPPSMLSRWRAIIVDSSAGDYWFSQILKHDDELCADWLRAWLTREAEGKHEFLPREVREAIAGLPVEVRATLIGDVPASAPLPLLQEAVRSLVSEDLDVMMALFDRPELEWLHSVALRGGPSKVWMDRALVALDRGWEPERIVSATQFSESAWSGEESQHWQGKIDSFAGLRRKMEERLDARQERIIAAGVSYFDRRRDEAAKREHRERVFGRGS